jgi:hypothetical protein
MGTHMGMTKGKKSQERERKKEQEREAREERGRAKIERKRTSLEDSPAQFLST